MSKHYFEHGGYCYDFDDLESLKFRLALVPDPNFKPLYKGHKEYPEALPPAALSKAAKCLGMKPKALLDELTAAGMPRVLTKEEMIGRVSHTGCTFIRFIRNARDSHGSCGRIYEVSWPGRPGTDTDFVHNHEQTTQWYHEGTSEEAKKAQEDFIARDQKNKK